MMTCFWNVTRFTSFHLFFSPFSKIENWEFIWNNCRRSGDLHDSWQSTDSCMSIWKPQARELFACPSVVCRHWKDWLQMSAYVSLLGTYSLAWYVHLVHRKCILSEQLWEDDEDSRQKFYDKYHVPEGISPYPNALHLFRRWQKHIEMQGETKAKSRISTVSWFLRQRYIWSFFIDTHHVIAKAACENKGNDV